ncbi:MAG TPA: ATP-binding protein [Propionibacteriaceae bacterium]|nr:ATP-binding protein [Propionibacteriaceae bacterium]
MPLSRPSRGTRSGVRRELVMLYAVAAMALVVVALGAVVASRSVAQTQALTDSEVMTQRLADLVVAPLLQESLTGHRQRHGELHRGIQNRMRDGHLTEVTVWAADGTIVFSDDPAKIGEQEVPPREVAAAIEHGRTTSAFAMQPESGDDVKPNGAGFVEVYVPLRMVGQPLMAFEAYYDYQRVNETAKSLMWRMVPLVLVPLILLQLIQIPIVASLAGRIRRHEADRASLLKQTLSVSDRERSQIAGDLHDGPIQDLAGVGYALGALASGVPEERRGLMTQVQTTVHHAIDSLRRLMVDLYPPDLDVKQLPETIRDLTVPLQEQGIDVSTHVEPVFGLDNDQVTTLYRVAREVLANVAQHSHATAATVSLAAHAGASVPSAPTVTLFITDNGVGIDPQRLDRRAEGHLGLRLLRDRVQHLNGVFNLASGPDGTAIKVELPLAGSAAARRR